MSTPSYTPPPGKDPLDPDLGDWVYVYNVVGTSYGEHGKIAGVEYTEHIKSLVEDGFMRLTLRPVSDYDPRGYPTHHTPDVSDDSLVSVGVVKRLIRDHFTGVDGRGYAPIQIVYVSLYGATGDGVTDDTDAIQSALDAVPAKGGTVYFPPGRYKVSPRGLRYGSQDTYGALYPKANTRLLGDGAMSCILLEDGTEKVDVIYARQKNGLAFEGLQIDAGPRQIPYWTTCIQLNDCDDLVLNNVTVTRGNIEGIYLYDCAGFRISNIHAHRNGNYREDASGLHLDTCHDGWASNLTLNNNGFHGLIVSTSWEISISNVVAFSNGWQGIHLQTGSNKIMVNGALLRGNSRGMYIRDWGTDNNLFANVIVAHNNFAGIMVYVAYGNVINGLQAIGNGEFGVETSEADDELIVFGAHFKDNGGGSHRAALNSFLTVNGRRIVGTTVGDPV